MCCVMPPASPAATSVSRMASSSDVFPWSTWPMIVMTGGRSMSCRRCPRRRAPPRRPRRPSGCSPSCRRRRKHLDRLVRERLGERGHLAQLHQLLDDLGAESWSDSATSLTVEPERTGPAGPPGAQLGGRRCLRLEIRLHPLGTAPRPRRCGPAAAAAACVAPRRLRVDHNAPAPAAASRRRPRLSRRPRRRGRRGSDAGPPPRPPPPPPGRGRLRDRPDRGRLRRRPGDRLARPPRWAPCGLGGSGGGAS